jgi:hypothetical protein
MRSISAACLAASMMLVSGCQGARQLAGVLGDLRKVQEEVARATGHADVAVNLNNNRVLIVGLVNSRFGALPEEARRAKAREIAQVAQRTLSSRSTLDRIVVTFVVHRRYLLFFNYTNAMDSFAFAPGELQDVPDVPVAVVRRMSTGPEAHYFRYYCVGVSTDTLTDPVSTEARIRSVQHRTDPAPALLGRLRQSSSHIVPASECDSAGEAVFHRPTKKKPALLVVVGPVETLSAVRVRVTVFYTSGILTETFSLLELLKKDAEWQVVSERILLQA